MHDIRAIREAPDTYRAGWARRGVADADAQVDAILALDARLRAAKTRFEQAQAERNATSKLIGAAKAQRDEARAAELMAQVEALKGVLAESEAEQKAAEAELNGQNGVLAKLPNLAAEGVPHGGDETGNVEQTRVGDPAATPAGRGPDRQPRGSRRAAGADGLRGRRPHVGLALRGAQGPARPAGARARPVHARRADHAERLHRGEPAAAGARRRDVRNRTVAEVFERLV